jgi:ribosomal protein S18 acetylase RimI-like enzyme
MINIRPASVGDAEAVAGMARALSLSDGGRPSDLTAEKFRADGFGDSPAFSAVIAELDQDIAGYAVFYRGYDTDSATRGVYLADLYVRRDFRRRGVGRALIVAVAAHCREDGARWMFWSVLKRNRPARKFYRRISTELKDVVLCAAFGKAFDRLSEMDS